MFEGPNITLAWCNDRYQSMLEEPFKTSGALGLPLRRFCPLGYVSKARALADAIKSGMEHSGIDRTFSVEDGITRYRWAIYSPAPGRALALIEIEGDPSNDECAGSG